MAGVAVACSLAGSPSTPRSPDLQTKLGRGELFEVIGFLGYLREAVPGPLIASRVGAPPRGVRHLESVAPAEGSAGMTGATPPVCRCHRPGGAS